jgi:hypothetical protein
LSEVFILEISIDLVFANFANLGAEFAKFAKFAKTYNGRFAGFRSIPGAETDPGWVPTEDTY